MNDEWIYERKGAGVEAAISKGGDGDSAKSARSTFGLKLFAVVAVVTTNESLVLKVDLIHAHIYNRVRVLPYLLFFTFKVVSAALYCSPDRQP